MSDEFTEALVDAFNATDLRWASHEERLLAVARVAMERAALRCRHYANDRNVEVNDNIGGAKTIGERDAALELETAIRALIPKDTTDAG